MISLLLFCLSFGASAAVPKAELHSISVKRIPVTDEAHARRILEAQKNYYELLFSQSRLPFSDWTRWLASCLRDNFPGKIRERRGNLSLHVQTTTDFRANEGYCGSGGHLKLYFVFSYCKGEAHVSEYKLPQSEQFSPEEIDLCQ